MFVCCAILFNVMGYLDNYLKQEWDSGPIADAVYTMTRKRDAMWDAKRSLFMPITEPEATTPDDDYVPANKDFMNDGC